MGYPPVKVDEEIAAAKFAADLAIVCSSKAMHRHGWQIEQIETLHWKCRFLGTNKAGAQHEYWVRLGAEYYDDSGPTVLFVSDTGDVVTGNSQWLPKLHTNPNWFRIHPNYQGQNYAGQLICFSYNAYYELTHNPPEESKRWRKGEHTVAAVLYTLQTILSPEYYECRLG